MSHRREKRARQAARLALMTAVSLESGLLAHIAIADEPQTTASQPAKQDELTEIVVTGYRLSLETALANKRLSDLPIESVSQEDIGKMPDQNVAETLQRLPGIQIDRSGQNGQGTSVLIDGLRQNLTTLNGDIFLSGKEFYVSGEASGGGAGSNAQYSSLETIPSELVSGIDVIKNPNAAITEGGMGGTINLKTMDPLTTPLGLSLAGVANESKADGTDTATPNGVLIGSYKLNDSLAFTGSVGYDKELTHTKEYQDANRNAWIDTDSAVGPYTGPLQPSDISRLGQYYIDPQLGYFSDILDQRVQNAASVGFAWKITDSVTTNFTWLYARENESTYTYSDKTWFNGQGAASGSLIPGINPTQPYSIDPNGVVQQGTFNANGAETASLYQDDITEANNFQWITKFNNGGPIRGLIDGAFSRATGNLQAAQADVEHGLYDTSAGVATSPAAPGCNNGASTCAPGTGSHGYQFYYNNGGSSGLPSVSYLPPYADILNNPAYATFKSNWAWANYTYQKDWSVKAEGQYDPAFITDVKMTITGGVRYANREVDETFGRYLINGTLANGEIAGNANGPDPSNPGAGFGPWLYYQDPGYGKPNIPYSTAASNPGLVATFPNFAVGNIIVKNPTTGGLNNPATYLEKVWAGAGVPNMTEQFFKDDLSSFEVRETTTAPYLMLDIGAPSSRFHANFGVRVVNTDLTINNGASAKIPTYYGTASWNGVDSNVVPVTTKRSYTDVLPSFNFVLDVTDTQIARFSAARVVAPQDLYQLGLGNTYGFTRQVGGRVNVKTGLKDGFYFNGGSSGNAELDPYRASQFLLAYENYFAPGAVASLGGFYKQVDNFVEVESIPTFVNDDFGGTTSNVTEPVNAGNARIYGLEFGSQYAFGDAIAWLNGFGFRANFTYSQSQSAQPTSFSSRGPIPGVSQNSATGTLYYENHGFSVRGSYSWRSKSINDSVVGSTFSFANQAGVQKTYQVFAAPYGQLDMQASYDFNKHVGVLVSVQNLTDEKQRTYLQWPDLPFTYDDWGRRYFVGIKGKL
jgi:iron complex outermembrane recepter protein